MASNDGLSQRLKASVDRLSSGIQRRLIAGAVSEPLEPERQALFLRSTQTLAMGGVLGMVEGGPLDLDTTDQVRAAFAVLADLASAEAEDAAAAMKQAVGDALEEAMKIGIAALMTAM